MHALVPAIRSARPPRRYLRSDMDMDAPTMNKNHGITMSASVTPFHGEWLMAG